MAGRGSYGARVWSALAPLTKHTKKMKITQVLVLALAAAGVMLSSSCCTKTPDVAPPVYVEPTK